MSDCLAIRSLTAISNKLTVTVTVGIDNGLANRKSAFKRFNGINQAISCPNLVNFFLVVSAFTLLKRIIFAAIHPQFDDDLHLSRWRFQTDWKIAILISAE